MSEYDENNVYAKNVKGDILHISMAESGRKGYFCLGCDREMQAVKSKIQFRASYFRHDPKAVQGQSKCTYRDETYRHRLSKEILSRLKSVRVPSVYKYPPQGQPGLANRLQESKVVEAHTVGLERIFYEDENGQIHCSSNKEVTDKYLIVKPDVTFFDRNGKPILLVELVATHKVSTEKKVKLKRLGIDVIQIKIPQDSPIEIENTIVSGTRTKWIYNHVEESTNYVRVPDGDSEGVSQFDEEQRSLFEETFVCRQSQIRNLVRTIRRCLESKPYRELEGEFRQELSRLASNTEQHRQRLRELREVIGKRVQEKLEPERRRIESEEAEFARAETDFRRRFKDLEKRYTAKRGEIGNAEKLTLSGDTGQATGITKLRAELDERIGQRRKELDETGRTNNGAQERIRRQIRDAEAETRRLDERMGTLPASYNQLRDAVERRIGKFKEDEENEIRIIEGETERLPEWFRQEEERIDNEFEELRRRSDEIIATRDSQRDSDLSRRIKKLLEARKSLDDFQKDYLSYKRNRKAWDSLNSGAWENWLE